MNDRSSELLTRFSLRRRITVFVLFLSIVVIGLIAMRGIPLELFPRGFRSQSLFVFVPWQNAPTQEVLDKITLPLEEELSTVRHLAGINSFSTVGRCNVFLRFKQGADMSVAYREVRDRVQRARVRFPEDVDRVFIRKEDASGIPVAVIGLAIDPKLTDYYNLIQKEVIWPLSRIDGVAAVNADGLEEKEILIEIDKQLAASNGLNIFALSDLLSDDNFSLASGHVRESGKKYLLRSVANYKSIQEVENKLISPGVRLRDIARIKYEEPEKRYSVRVNSRPAVAAVVLKEGEANTVDVSRKITAALEQMKKNPRLASVYMEDLFNQGKVVEESLHNLVSGGTVGAALAAVVLFVFLRRFRLTVIITLSIPLSLMIGLIVMFFAGETLNMLSILGLVICVGMLVDNSIVVAENIHRLHKEGLPRTDACVRGAAEIALAITMATLTTVVVFLPAALVEGEGQFFLIRLALPISVSLVASLFVALVFIPLTVYLTLPSRLDQPSVSRWRKWHDRLNAVLRRFYDLTFGSFNRGYVTALSFFLNHRFDLVLLLAAAFTVTHFFAYKKLQIVQTQEEDQTSFAISVEISNEYSFEEVTDYFRSVEQLLEKKQKGYGLRGYFVFYRTRFGRIEGWFEKNKPRQESAKTIAKRLLTELPQKPGMKLFYGRDNQSQDAKGRDVFMVILEGDDPALLDAVAEQIEPRFAAVDGVLGIRLGNEKAPSELAVVIDRDRTAATEINPQLIAGMVGYALRGNSLPKYNDAGKEIPVRVRFREEDRDNVTALASFEIPTATGDILPLSSLTSTKVLNTPKGIFRRDKKVARAFTIELTKEKAKTAVEQLMALQRQISLPEGVRFGAPFGRTQEEELASVRFAASLSILFIYLLMGFLFESFILPLSIILTIPLAGIGVAWIHRITGKDLDMLGIIGAILLVGVVVNNGIVLIDYINRLRHEGMDRTQALLRATERRFRPIAMTALTTIIGMVPLTVSEPTDFGLSYKSFGLTLIGGMTAATLLTLLVVPIFYTFFDDAREILARHLQSVWNRPNTVSTTLASDLQNPRR